MEYKDQSANAVRYFAGLRGGGGGDVRTTKYREHSGQDQNVLTLSTKTQDIVLYIMCCISKFDNLCKINVKIK